MKLKMKKEKAVDGVRNDDAGHPALTASPRSSRSRTRCTYIWVVPPETAALQRELRAVEATLRLNAGL